MTKDEIVSHAEFLGIYAGHIAALSGKSAGDAKSIEFFCNWFSAQCFEHAVKHIAEEPAETPQGEQNSTVEAKEGENPYPDMGKGLISTTEDIQRGWAANEKKRIYEDG